jgi:quercetin dioxygenase-like cupin family protein
LARKADIAANALPRPDVNDRFRKLEKVKMSFKASALSGLVSLAVLAFVPISADAAEGAKIVQADAFAWAPAQGLPPGAQVAVLYGDPAKAGPFAVRFKFPAGYEVATHSHPTDEFLTVISGKARLAFGEDADAASAEAFPVGAFMSLPAGAWHHLWADADTVIELHSTGPFGLTLAHH